MSGFESRKRQRTIGETDLIIGPPSAPVLTRNQQKELLNNMKKEFIDQISSCDVNERTFVMDNLTKSIAEIENGFDENPMTYTQSLLDSLDEEFKKMSIKGGGKRMKGGMIAAINPLALISYLIADAMKQGFENTKEIVDDVLQKGLQLLEFLSNKNGCAEQLLYQFLGKKMMDFFKFYLVGVLSTEAVKQNPLILLEKLAMLLPLFAKYGTKGIGMTMVTGVGYLIYHFVNHYSVPLGDGATKKVEELNKLLTTIHEATSEDVVVKVETKVNDLIKDVNDKHAELTAEMTEENKRDFMKQLGNNLTEEITNLKNLVGEFDDTMTMEQLREKINNSKKSDGGKRKRRTQRRKRFSNTKKAKRGKQTKKSSKVKKH